MYFLTSPTVKLQNPLKPYLFSQSKNNNYFWTCLGVILIYPSIIYIILIGYQSILQSNEKRQNPWCVIYKDDMKSGFELPWEPPPPKKTLVAKECSVSVCHSQIRPSLFTSGFKKRWWERSPRCFITGLHRPVSDITAATSIFYTQFLVLFLDTGTHRHQHDECEDWNSLTAS